MYIHRGIIIYYYISIEIAIIPLENEPYLIYFDLTTLCDKYQLQRRMVAPCH
jgi:hypothetical protein